jgi:hypothetical protein
MSTPALLSSISALVDVQVVRSSGSSAVVTAMVSSNKKLRKSCKRSISDWFQSVDIQNFPVPGESSDAQIRSKRVREFAGAQIETAIDVPKTATVSFKWTVAPGLFAGGVVDVMTLAMIKCLERPHARSRNLDFACGSGIITKWLLLAQPSCQVCMCDNDTVALEVAKINNPTAVVVLSDSWDTATESSSLAESCRVFDNIYSNPPLHRGDNCLDCFSLLNPYTLQGNLMILLFCTICVWVHLVGLYVPPLFYLHSRSQFCDGRYRAARCTSSLRRKSLWGLFCEWRDLNMLAQKPT